MNAPRSIAEWKALSAENPEKSAETYWSTLQQIPEAIRTSIFSYIPDLQYLKKAFSRSVSSSDRPLSGVPYLLKDLFDFPNTPTTASSAFLEEVRPGPHEESAASIDLRRQGAVFGGKTQLNEFAYGLSGENLHYGNCPHPFRAKALSGGSSSGSAWGVAKGISPIAFGTDTGGSIRVPAAWCGLFGFRFNPNAWSRNGCFPLASSFDTAGWFCARAEDSVASFSALITPKNETRTLKGLDLTDRDRLKHSAFKTCLLDTFSKLRVSSDKAFSDAFENASHRAARHFTVLQSSEALEAHKAWIETRKNQYDPAVWQRIARAKDWTDEDLVEARTGESKIESFFQAAFQEYDFITLPASWTSAISASEHTDSYRGELLDLTSPGSLARLPIFTLPIHAENRASTGIQILYKDPLSDLPLQIIEAAS